MDYWLEAVECALDEAGLKASEEQIGSIARVMEGAHETYGEATGQDVASVNLRGSQENQIAELKTQLHAEQRKEVCPECKGAKVLHTSYGTRTGTSQCYTCNGDGRL